MRTHFRHLHSKSFPWHKEIFNLMNFDSCNRPLKIQESIGTLTPTMGAHLGVWGSFPHTLLHYREHEMWFPSFTFSLHLCKPLLWSPAQGYGCNTQCVWCMNYGCGKGKSKGTSLFWAWTLGCVSCATTSTPTPIIAH
jgi:hypothetical protein